MRVITVLETCFIRFSLKKKITITWQTFCNLYKLDETIVQLKNNVKK